MKHSTKMALGRLFFITCILLIVAAVFISNYSWGQPSPTTPQPMSDITIIGEGFDIYITSDYIKEMSKEELRDFAALLTILRNMGPMRKELIEAFIMRLVPQRFIDPDDERE